LELNRRKTVLPVEMNYPLVYKKKGEFQFCCRNSIKLLRMRNSNVLEVPVNHNWKKKK